MSLRSAFSGIAPTLLVDNVRRRRILSQRRKFELLETEQVFSQIYAQNMWGGESGSFNSGSGSAPEVVFRYVELVRSIIQMHGITSVLDFGCGDFQVGSQLVSSGIDYIGVDIVPDLIRRNTERFSDEHVTFVHGDITRMRPPIADLVLVRQVLQHLSNLQIQQALTTLRMYPLVVVSEHYPNPSGEWEANKDKPHGPDTRVVDGSAVVLDSPPFNVSGIREILRVPARATSPEDGQTIRTFLLKNSSDSDKS